MRTLYLRIRPDRISLLRFLLEGYDGLAVLSTIDVRQGLVRLMVPACRYAELWSLLAAICGELAQERVALEVLEENRGVQRQHASLPGI